MFGWWEKKEPKALPVYTTAFQQAWRCRCGYITAENQYIGSNNPQKRFCVDCGCPVGEGTQLVGKWTFNQPDDTRPFLSHLLSFETYQEKDEQAGWCNVAGVYEIYHRKHD